MADGRKEGHAWLGMHAWISVFFVGLGILIAPVRIHVLTHHLSRHDYGLFSLLSLTATSLGFVGLLGLRNYLIYVLPGKSREEQGTHFNSAAVVALLCGALVAAGFLLAGHTVPLLARSFPGELIVITALFIPLYTLAHLGMGYLLGVGEVVRYRALNFLSSCLWLCVAIPLLLVRTVSLVQLAVVWLGGLLATLLLIAASSLKKLGPGASARPVVPVMKAGVRYGFPLLPRYFALALFKMADRFVILKIMGSEAVAVYTVAATLIIFAAETQTFLEFLFPRLSTAWSRNLEEGKPGCAGAAADHLHAVLRLSLVSTVPLTVGLLLWGQAVVVLLAGEAYSGAGILFPIMCPLVMMIPLTSTVQFAVTLDGKTIGIGNSILAASLTNLVLNLLLVPRWGIAGAGAATSFSYALLFVITMIMCRPDRFLRWRALQVPGIVLSGAVMAAVALAVRTGMGRFSLLEVPLSCFAYALTAHRTGVWSLGGLLASLQGWRRGR